MNGGDPSNGRRGLFVSSLVAAAITGALAVVSLGLVPPGVFFSTDAGSKYLLAESLIRHDPDWPALPYPGAAIDPQRRYFPISDVFSLRRGSQDISAFPIYYTLLNAPLLALFGFRGLLLLPLAAAAGAMLLFARMGRALRWSGFWQGAGPVLLILATPLAFYALTFWEHVPAATLFIASLALVAPAFSAASAAAASAAPAVPSGSAASKVASGSAAPAFPAGPLESERRRWLFAGGLVGLCTVLRLEFAWAAAGLVLSLLSLRPQRRACLRREALPFLAGFGAGALLLLLLNLSVYGDAAGPQVRANLAAPGAARIEILSNMLAGSGRPIFWSVLALLILGAGLIPDPRAQKIRLALLVPMALLPLMALLRSPAAADGSRSIIGALETSPFVLLLPLAGMRSPKGVMRTDLFFGRAALVCILGIALTSPVDGGLQGGNRLLIPGLALAVAAACVHLSTRRSGSGTAAWTRRALLLLLACSIPLSLRAVALLLDRTIEIERPGLEMLRGAPGDAVVYTNPYFPQGLAAAYWDRPAFGVDDFGELDDLLGRLARSGGRSVVVVSWAGTPAPAAIDPAGPGDPQWMRYQERVAAGTYQFDLYRAIRSG